MKARTEQVAEMSGVEATLSFAVVLGRPLWRRLVVDEDMACADAFQQRLALILFHCELVTHIRGLRAVFQVDDLCIIYQLEQYPLGIGRDKWRYPSLKHAAKNATDKCAVVRR